MRDEPGLHVTTPEEMKSDGNWRCTFHQAFTGEYGHDYDARERGDIGPVKDVVDVISCSAGEHDGPDWIALVRLQDGRYAKVFAGCDYTGWD